MNTDTKEQLARLRLIRTANVGPATYHTLMERYGSAAQSLDSIGGLSLKGGRRRPLEPAKVSRVRDEWDRTRALGASFLFCDDPTFPDLLSETSPTPPVIVVRGHGHLLNKKTVAMVGSRNASANGRKLAATLAREIGEAGYTVVSGMARGIDTAAHKGSLESGTCAVLAGGIDSVYPPENEDLYHHIVTQGCIVSEMPLGHVGRAKDFPRRNRLISGLALGVIIVEAALRSGSLITARFALEQSREVFAVPGSPLDPRCRGANSLLKQGAALIENAEDVLEVLETFETHKRLSEKERVKSKKITAPKLDVSEDDVTVLRDEVISLLGPTATDIDDLVRESGGAPGLIRVILMELDLAGRLERLPGNKVCLRSQDD